MSRGLVDGGEDTLYRHVGQFSRCLYAHTHGGFDNVLGTDLTPLDVHGVTLAEDVDGLALDDELAILGLDRALEGAVDGVVLEHVHHVVEIDERTANV